MNRIILSLCLWALGTLSSNAALKSELDQLISALNPKVNLGMVVLDLSAGEKLYTRNAGRLFIPASNLKLFSEAAALMVLGPDYRFTNQLSTDAKVLQQGVLHGNLYLILSGDPSFTRSDLKGLIFALKNWGIKAIEGRVFIDSSLAEVTPYPSGWVHSDLAYAYAAPIAPLMLDSNRLTLTVNPAGKEGELALIEVEDNGPGIRWNNQVMTQAKGKGCGVKFSLDKQNQLLIKGCVGLGQRAVQQSIAIKDPLRYAQGRIKSELLRAGVHYSGSVDLGKAPAGSLLIATQRSNPLRQLMADTLKPSDNLYADSLYLHAAACLNAAPVNWDQAQSLVKNFLQQQTGIDLSNAVFNDGSGLSRSNRVTPEQTVGLLQFLYRRFPLSFEYIAALPVSGQDGTLQKRLRDPNQQGFVRAKTGYMTDIHSLSGYLYTRNGHTLAFTLFLNRLPGSKATAPERSFLDTLTAYLLQQSPGTSPSAQAFDRVQQPNPMQEQASYAEERGWRRLESMVKNALKGQLVHVLYRGNELLIRDKQTDAYKVWSALQALSKKYAFAVALVSQTLPIEAQGKPMLLWMQTPATEVGTGQRTWIIREAAL